MIMKDLFLDFDVFDFYLLQFIFSLDITFSLSWRNIIFIIHELISSVQENIPDSNACRIFPFMAEIACVNSVIQLKIFDWELIDPKNNISVREN